MGRKRIGSLGRLGWILALGCLTAQAGVADTRETADTTKTAAALDTAPATVAWSASDLRLTLQNGGEYRLTVTGPGFDFRIRGQGLVSFRAVDQDGLPLPDGIYRYELREVVTGPAIEAWEKVTDGRERQALQRQLMREGLWPAPPRIQHDVFRIEGGRLIAPEERAHSEAAEAVGGGVGHAHPHVD